LTQSADFHGFSYRRQFLGQMVELLVEQPRDDVSQRHGRCERYFEVHFDSPNVHPGQAVKVRIENVTTDRTEGRIVHVLD
jgi:tRNA A37 methylthiotransferase MiaB